MTDNAKQATCRTCRFWGGLPDDEGMGECRVSGSFHCTGRFMTEPSFGCIHHSARTGDRRLA